MTQRGSFIDDLKQFIESDKLELPVFNPVAMKIQQELIKKDPDMAAVEQLIIKDQSLASTVLKLANSSYYKGLVEVKTIRAAMVRLGLREVSRIVLLASSKLQFKTSDKRLKHYMKKLWQHSAGNALAANWLARKCNFSELADQAFFAGLLHDIGKLFLLTVIEQSNLRKSGKMTETLLLEIVDSLHSEEGYKLMKRWNMPEQYCLVVRDHHQPDLDIKNTLLVLVRLANLACHKLGIGLYSPTDMNLAATTEANLLDLSEIKLAELEIMLEDTKALTG